MYRMAYYKRSCAIVIEHTIVYRFIFFLWSSANADLTILHSLDMLGERVVSHSLTSIY